MNNDLISREALKKSLKSNCDVCHDKNTNWCEHCCPLNDFEDLIDDAPAVRVFLTNEEVKEFAKDNFNTGYEMAKEKIIHSIAKQYSEHNELVPIWLSIGDIKDGAE